MTHGQTNKRTMSASCSLWWLRRRVRSRTQPFCAASTRARASSLSVSICWTCFIRSICFRACMDALPRHSVRFTAALVSRSRTRLTLASWYFPCAPIAKRTLTHVELFILQKCHASNIGFNLELRKLCLQCVCVRMGGGGAKYGGRGEGQTGCDKRHASRAARFKGDRGSHTAGRTLYATSKRVSPR